MVAKKQPAKKAPANKQGQAAKKEQAAKDPKKSMAAKLAHEERMAIPLARLAGLRTDAGWSKAKAADAAGMDPTTYSRIERCVVNPFPAQAEAIAKAFGVSVDDLTQPVPLPEADVAQCAQAAELAPVELPEKADPLVELGERVKALENVVRMLSAEFDGFAESMGLLKARVEQTGGKVAAVEDIGTPGITGALEQVDAGNGTMVYVTVYAPGALGGEER